MLSRLWAFYICWMQFWNLVLVCLKEICPACKSITRQILFPFPACSWEVSISSDSEKPGVFNAPPVSAVYYWWGFTCPSSWRVLQTICTFHHSVYVKTAKRKACTWGIDAESIHWNASPEEPTYYCKWGPAFHKNSNLSPKHGNSSHQGTKVVCTVWAALAMRPTGL